ncbi:MAG TPA: CPBP family intramembrane glutamic endopeptidase [Actinomycetes bacterium]|jgi:membrane protease YdiL (CAAX protease family)|nr:CPBP family intramembrane glutamic endopeptidase [Actinomycetes bacterium]
MGWAVLVTAGVIAYNNTLNRWPPFNRALYIPLNLGLAAVLLLVAAGPLGLDARALGLNGGIAAGAAAGAAIGATLTLPLFAGAAAPAMAARLADRRVAGLRGRRLAYQVLVRIPVGTALVEEVTFRGVLLAAWRPWGLLPAVGVSSLAFGLWHVAPTIELVRANRPAARGRTVVLVTLAAVVTTTSGGLGLAWLRLGTGGLAAPVAMHASLNGLATLAGLLAHRTATRVASAGR